MWQQKGWAVISEVRADGVEGWMPYVHAFSPSALNAGEEETKARELPEHLRVGLRIVSATLNVDA